MTKILLSAYACMPNRGSEEGNGWAYACLLSKQGLQVHCLTRVDFREAIEAVLALGDHPNLTVHYVSVPGWLQRSYGTLLGMYTHYIWWQWQASQLARQLDRQINFDLVHHVTYSSLQLGSFMYRLGKPFVFGPVGGGQRVPFKFRHYLGGYWSREVMRDGVSWLLQRLNPGFYRTMKLANRVLISNTDTLRLARKYRANKPIERVLDSGIAGEFLAHDFIQRPPNPPVLNLLWVGRLLPRKALELTIHAFSRVDRTLPIRLTIVGGDGQIAQQVPNYLERYNVADRVDWVGQIPYSRVQQYYKQSDIFLFTSLRDSCPMQLFEAMAYSLPVVTLALHGQAEIVDGRNGIKVPVQTPEQVVSDLAKAIERLYYHPEERLTMGQQAYDYAQLQSWDEKIKLYINQIYPQLVGRSLQETFEKIMDPGC